MPHVHMRMDPHLICCRKFVFVVQCFSVLWSMQIGEWCKEAPARPAPAVLCIFVQRHFDYLPVANRVSRKCLVATVHSALASVRAVERELPITLLLRAAAEAARRCMSGKGGRVH